LYCAAGLAPLIPLNKERRPTWRFGKTVHRKMSVSSLSPESEIFLLARRASESHSALNRSLRRERCASFPSQFQKLADVTTVSITGQTHQAMRKANFQSQMRRRIMKKRQIGIVALVLLAAVSMSLAQANKNKEMKAQICVNVRFSPSVIRRMVNTYNW
jgi:hypothetical protein